MMTDPIADMLTRLRNANTAMKAQVDVPTSKVKEEVAKILTSEGFIRGFDTVGDGPQRTLRIQLKYAEDRTRAVQGVRRVSSPGLRVYKKASDLPRVNGGLGVAIVSTSQGLLPDREARRRRLGGEIMCEVW